MQETQHSTTPAAVLPQKQFARKWVRGRRVLRFRIEFSSLAQLQWAQMKAWNAIYAATIDTLHATLPHRLRSRQANGWWEFKRAVQTLCLLPVTYISVTKRKPLRFTSPLAGGCKRNGKTIPKSSRSDPSVSQAKGGSVTLVTLSKSCQACTLIEKRNRRFKTLLLHKRKSKNFPNKTFAIKLATSRREGERNCLEKEMSFISSCW